MNKNQNFNQEQKKHFLISNISRRTLRFTTALCAAAMLAGGVAYAAPAETIAPGAAATESTFTDVVMTTYAESDLPTSKMVRQMPMTGPLSTLPSVFTSSHRESISCVVSAF